MSCAPGVFTGLTPPQSTRTRRRGADQLLRGRRARDAHSLPRFDRRAAPQTPQPRRDGCIEAAEAVRAGAGYHNAGDGRGRE